ncbi:class III poly(R)-hydroxyalkanoic acid synthase subunit PhaC [Marinobacterium sp. D7]|uniref:class III poly(R)-hydroxyalkanoic acid synthase subunit PhaC n=1 Tax=Marinobacterium ramblicola TaxID=2849041 RepID=UPI001C2D00C8|nr:class III poly(R)-hydroxyalkanoic acid synthase subunit PhaC [Marinobacterium ramblicola]MBV1786539.1 class III poly(R)-hydroxyalkanoic acid synthase subunit PhaC [Marinobacterium ramblicola]
MKGLQLDPETIRQELVLFNQRLQQSYETLKTIEGVDVGTTPRSEIYRNDKTRLYHYTPRNQTQNRLPLLICYALVNRPYIADLQPDRSLIASLLDQGIPVYLIDWGYPDEGDRYLDLDDYIEEYLDGCVNACIEHAASDKVNLLGICQGGTFSLCYTALHPERVRNLITMVTPVDFHTDDFILSHLAMKVDADLAVATYGNIPGEVLNDTYNSLMPMRLGVQKNLGLPAQLSDRDKALNFLRMEQWINDGPDQAGEAFRSFIQQFFQRNLLLKGEVKIGSKQIDLKTINQPILNIIGAHDHLVPPSSSRALETATSSQDYNEICVNAGHIGVFVSSRALKQVPESIARWLQARD